MDQCHRNVGHAPVLEGDHGRKTVRKASLGRHLRRAHMYNVAEVPSGPICLAARITSRVNGSRVDARPTTLLLTRSLPSWITFQELTGASQ